MRTIIAVLLVVAASLVGCGDDDAERLPPVAASEIVPLYAEALAEHDMVLTTRGGLVDPDDYEPSPDGTHLALYLAPTRELDDQAYARGVVELTALFASDVFDRWPRLESFDVCQEVFTGRTGPEAEQTRSQVALTREVAADIAWGEVGFDELHDITSSTDGSSWVRLDEDLRAHLGLDRE